MKMTAFRPWCRQWLWQPHGWSILLAIGRAWGLGFFVMGGNGTDVYLGPFVLSVMPPMPKSWKFMTDEEVKADDSNIVST